MKPKVKHATPRDFLSPEFPYLMDKIQQAAREDKEITLTPKEAENLTVDVSVLMVILNRTSDALQALVDAGKIEEIKRVVH